MSVHVCLCIYMFMCKVYIQIYKYKQLSIFFKVFVYIWSFHHLKTVPQLSEAGPSIVLLLVKVFSSLITAHKWQASAIGRSTCRIFH